MEKPIEEATFMEVTGGGYLQPPERAPLRWRLVQATLFPHKETEDCDEEGDQDDEEDKYCGSQSKKKRKLKPKAIPQSRTSKKENSRIFAGRRIHPFFSSWKTSKRSQEPATVENNFCSDGRKDKSITFSPIHVFEKVQDDSVSLNWGSWIFSEGSCISTNSGLESTWTPAFEGSVKPIHFDNFLSVSPNRVIVASEGGFFGSMPYFTRNDLIGVSFSYSTRIFSCCINSLV